MISHPNLPVYLRALSPDDVERTWRWHNDSDLYRNLGGVFRPVSRATEVQWIQHAITASPNHMNLGICTASDSQHIGNLYLRDIDWVSRHAELHVFIGDKTIRGRGYGQAAIQLIQQYARDTLCLHRLFLEVIADNKTAIHAYAKCGFVTEGRMPNHVFKEGTFKDVLIMGYELAQPTRNQADAIEFNEH